jgi:hypothetical protein
MALADPPNFGDIERGVGGTPIAFVLNAPA